MSRDIRHFIKAGVTLGVDVQDGKARIAVAFLNRHETRYSRPAARHHINLRFDADDTTLKSLGLSRNVVSFPYSGDKPRLEILFPVSDALQGEMHKRIRSNRYGGSTSQMLEIIRIIARGRNRMIGGGNRQKVSV